MPHYQRIKDLREDEDKTQSDIAKILGTTAQYYGKYEKGEREIPFSRAIELAEFYNVSLDYLAGKTNVKRINIKSSISEDERKILDMYQNLSERNKGKAELFIEQLLEKQSNWFDESKISTKVHFVIWNYCQINKTSPLFQCETVWNNELDFF